MVPAQDNTEKIALKILQSGVELPPLPAVFTRLLTLSRQPEDRIDVGKFTKLLQTDPALTARILQLANSSYYGTLNKISNLRQAIMHIGLQETISTVNWMLSQKILPQFPTMEGFTDKDYWAHSWACASAARLLGRPDLGVSCQPGELYVAGLLHGIGKLILALHQPDDFRQCLENSRDFSQPLEDAEKELLGTTHSDIACEILRTWQFPASICNAVKYFLSPADAPPEFREIAGLTQFAYFIANTSGVGNNGDEFNFNIDDTYLANLDSSPFSSQETRERLVQSIRKTLQQKATAVTGVSVTDDISSDEPSPAKERQELQSPRRKTQTPGFWSRIFGSLSRLFG